MPWLSAPGSSIPIIPGYWFPAFYDAYRRGDYRGALSIALRINMPGFFYTHVVIAAAHGQLGERDAAGKALQELLKLRPDFAVMAREELGKFFQAEFLEHLIDGIRKAGLEPGDGGLTTKLRGRYHSFDRIA